MTAKQTPSSEQWKVVFLGDFFIGKKSSGARLSPDLKSFLNGHDLVCLNFEGALRGKGSPIQKPGPHLEQKEDVTTTLHDWGVDVVSLGNNHIMDFGFDGLNHTLNKLNECRIGHFGAGGNAPEAFAAHKRIMGTTKLALVSIAEGALYGIATESTPGHAWVGDPLCIQRIQELSDQADVIIVLVHAGAECVPLPLPEWRKRYQKLCDAGADVIIGSHPHVAQPWETYGNAYIFYSLGNSWFDFEKDSYSQNHGYAVSLEFSKTTLTRALVALTEKRKEILTLSKSRAFKNHLINGTEILANREQYISMANQQARYLWDHVYSSFRAYIMMIRHKDDPAWIVLAKRLCALIPNFKRVPRELSFNHLFAIESHRWTIKRSLLNPERSDRTEPAFQNLLDAMNGENTPMGGDEDESSLINATKQASVQH